MKNGLVSIVTPCYNGENYVHKLIESVLNQTYTSIQFIIVNDGSNDNTQKILESYEKSFKNNNIEYIHLYQENKGQAAAINKALEVVNGEFLIWPDSDDYLQPDSIENMVKELNNNKKADFVIGKVAFRNEENEKEIVRIRQIQKRKNLFKNYLLNKRVYCYSGVIMTRMSKFDSEIENRNIYESRGGQNWQMILPIAYKGKPSFINDIVYNYIIRKSSHSHYIKSKEEKLARIDEHKNILMNVFSKIEFRENEIAYYEKLLRKVYERDILKLECEFKSVKLVNLQFKKIILNNNFINEDLIILIKFYIKRIINK